ncbi:MAG TPA: hypothetical protein ENN09_06955 [Planctomycetes bacterium]|mgnify:CR=1 FL=1|nr:hypothetical protein [Planctomycetota bacterium]
MEIERLPRFSENMESATVTRVLVREGDVVRQGAPLFEMVTSKAEFDYESTVAGTVLAVLAGEKDELPVGYALLVTGEADEQSKVEEIREENRRLLAAFRPGGMNIETATGTTGGGRVEAGEKVRATPAARRLAKEKGVELAAVKEALNITGIVREENVVKYAERKGEAG